MKKFRKIVVFILTVSLFIQPLGVYAYTKEETVYSNLNYDGKVEDVKINNHLSKLEKEDVEDETILTGVMNLNGEEKYEQEDSKLIWKSTGKDIFYQGKTDKELPIEIELKYYLDGKEQSPEEMFNKKGEVEVKINLKNKAFDGDENLHVPFVVTAGLVLNSTENQDITVTNGEVIETGKRAMVFSLTAPGLYDDFKLKEFEKLDEITVKYTTTKFVLNNIYLVASPKLLGKVDLKTFEKAKVLDSSIGLIQNNMNKIEKGAKVLEGGTTSLAEGSTEITENLSKVLDAVKKLENGSNSLSTSLNQVLKALEEAKSTLANKNISSSLEKVSGLIETNSQAITNLKNTNSGLESTYVNNSLGNFKTDDELIAYFTNMGLDQNSITSLLTCKKTYEGNLSLIKLLEVNKETLNTLVTSLREVESSINMLLTELENGIGKMESGSREMTNGLTQVSLGLDKLLQGSAKVTAGSRELEDGSGSLSSGIVKLNKEGISTLKESSTKLDDYSKKAQRLVRLAKDYDGFASNNSNKSVFIYKVKVIK